VHVYTISAMVPWFDSIAYNAVMCSLPRFYSNEGIQPNTHATHLDEATARLSQYVEERDDEEVDVDVYGPATDFGKQEQEA
jgi:hypothetical protein